MNKDIKFIIAAGTINRVTVWGDNISKTSLLGMPLFDTWDDAYAFLLITAVSNYAAAKLALLGVLC